MDERHPAEPGDTDWGRALSQMHRENIVRFERLERRFVPVESDIKRIDKEIHNNTELVHSIKSDTESIVKFAQAANALRRFMLWATPIASALISFYVAWTVKK